MNETERIKLLRIERLVDDLDGEIKTIKVDYKKLEHEKDYWKECYEIAIGHLKEIEKKYFIEHTEGFLYKDGIKG